MTLKENADILHIRYPGLPQTVQRTFLVQPPPKADETSISIEAIPTSLIIQHFADRTLISISQLSNRGTYMPGTIMRCSVDWCEITGKPAFSVEVLLGRRDDPLLSIYGRQIAEKICGISNRNCTEVLLMISLKGSGRADDEYGDEGRDRSTFVGILNELRTMATHA
eukprot:CAMPEP_0194296104 /NCGR_PEP_ID=MMETSP0169-20130528/55175_1 /TAXON_ID=218684 /ORGANISM="Corethron pennatum, Strain L29A3" /LENGTH=166 /DNA_ID=CAMNT_0039045465 /DNA_START=261 /DNA_END=758 /DNA_ORIENTATION=+